MTRLSKVEEYLETLKDSASPCHQESSSATRRHSYPKTQELELEPEDSSFRGGTSLVKSITILQNNVGCETPSEHDLVVSEERQSEAECGLVHCNEFQECCKGDLQLFERAEDAQSDHIETLRSCFDLFFSCPHPHRKFSSQEMALFSKQDRSLSQST